MQCLLILNVEGQLHRQESDSYFSLFLRGFGIRLLYGILAMPLCALVGLPVFDAGAIFAWSFYLFVCLAGGIYDASIGQKTKLNLWERPGSAQIVYLGLMILGFLLLHKHPYFSIIAFIFSIKYLVASTREQMTGKGLKP